MKAVKNKICKSFCLSFFSFLYLSLSAIACQTVQQPKSRADVIHWSLIIDGENYTNIKSGTVIQVSNYTCEMDKAIRRKATSSKMPIRWLQCENGDNFFRLMANCKNSSKDDAYLLLGKSTSRHRVLMQLSCRK